MKSSWWKRIAGLSVLSVCVLMLVEPVKLMSSPIGREMTRLRQAQLSAAQPRDLSTVRIKDVPGLIRRSVASERREMQAHKPQLSKERVAFFERTCSIALDIADGKWPADVKTPDGIRRVAQFELDDGNGQLVLNVVGSPDGQFGHSFLLAKLPEEAR